MGLKDELKSILRHLRKMYYLRFKKEYVREQLRKRKGVCGRHGCCDLTFVSRFTNRNCLSKKDRTKCLKWDNLPEVCKIYPFDEKDKHHLAKDFCNFYWENSEKKKLKLEVRDSNSSHN